MELMLVALVPIFVLGLASIFLIVSQMTGFIQFSRFRGRQSQSNRLLSQVMEEIALAQSELYRRAHDLEDLSQRLRLSNQELARLNAMKSKFLTMVAHDMRTPLTAIQGFSQLLSARTDPKQRKYLQHIVNAGQRMALLTSDLTDLAMIEAGKLQMTMAPFDFTRMARELLPGLSLIAEKKNVELLAQDLPDALPVEGDRFRLSQVVQNLLNNAVKFTPAGGKVWLRARLEGDRLWVQVRDTGPGIHPAERRLIFEKFYQSAHQRDERLRKQGWGLGLAISAEIVRAHGGTIDVESAGLGKGAAFFFRVPLKARKTWRSMARAGGK